LIAIGVFAWLGEKRWSLWRAVGEGEAALQQRQSLIGQPQKAIQPAIARWGHRGDPHQQRLSIGPNPFALGVMAQSLGRFRLQARLHD